MKCWIKDGGVRCLVGDIERFFFFWQHSTWRIFGVLGVSLVSF